MYKYIYVYEYMIMNIYIHVYIHVYTYIYAYICICIYIKIYTLICIDLPNKTTRQKLEDAVDAAHRTHGIGFPDSPNSPKDRGLPTSFHDHDPSSIQNKDTK
jgi:hypothetical protein